MTRSVAQRANAANTGEAMDNLRKIQREDARKIIDAFMKEGGAMENIIEIVDESAARIVVNVKIIYLDGTNDYLHFALAKTDDHPIGSNGEGGTVDGEIMH